MSSGITSLKKILILVTILAVPGFLYYLLTEKGKNRYKPLGIYGPKTVASTFHKVRGESIADTIYHTVSNFGLTNQDSISFRFGADTNHIIVCNFFFTRCKTSCSEMNQSMSEIAKAYEKNKMVRFVSITVDPDYDSPSVLKRYSKQFKIDKDKWQFLTGTADSVYKIAQRDFLVDAFKDSSQTNNFIHSSKFILVDPQKRIRGYYDSADKEQVTKLVDEIKVQITEELRKVK